MKHSIDSKVLIAAILLAGDLAFVAIPSEAVSTLVWRVQTQEQFREGEPKGVSLTPTGEVVLAPSLQLLSSTGEPYVWSLARDPRGNIYAGTGNGGKVFRMEKGEASLYFDPPGAQIYSLAVGPRGALYVGSSPEGTVYKVDPDGNSSEFFKSEERYVWSMVFDPKGNLYVGCGEKGKVYVVNRKGDGTLLYDSEERHVLSLLWDDNKLYAGTEGAGLVYRIDPGGEAMGIFDPPEREVPCILLHPSGDLYAAATRGIDSPEVGKTNEKPSGKAQSALGKGKGSAIYRVSPQGAFVEAWSSPLDRVLALGLRSTSVLAGTGDEGHFYLVDPVEGPTELLQCEDSQILSLLDVQGEVYLGTGNMGRVYRVGRGYRDRGELLSEVKDAQTISRWGRISWVGDAPSGTGITLQTRSGNTEEVDRTWSGWSSKYSNGDKVQSPEARFIQWRTVLSTADPELSPTLSSVEVAYLPQNLPPTITSVHVLPPGLSAGTEDLVKSKALSQDRRKLLEERGISLPDQVYELERGSRSVWWQAKDPNGDSLTYRVYFKGLQEREWKILEKDLKSTSHTFDSFSLPDGYYKLKVVADDLAANPRETALTAERMSEDFLVDNSPPVLETPVVNSASGEVKVKAQDSLSPLSWCEYSIDGGEWQTLFPADEIFDSKTERFSFRVKGLSPGEHTIAIKVMDAHSNVGSSKRVFHIR